MKNNISRKMKQVPSGYLLVGTDPHKHKHAIITMDQQAMIRSRFKISNNRQGFEYVSDQSLHS